MTSSITQAVAETLDRIAAANPALNAFITVFADTALAQAEQLDREQRQGRSRGPLHGRIISVKDLIDVAGVPTTAASRVRSGHVAERDAEIVVRLKNAGAVIIGKTNLHELALGTTSDESAFGAVHHPLDHRRSPGGSSGGSAAAVAAGLGWASIGTDTGGSIRIPAAACGIVGLKATFGEIPTAGVVPLSVSLDHVGPLASNVRDTAAMFSALSDRTPVSLDAGTTHLKLARLGGCFLEKLHDEVRDRFERSIERLRAAGVIVTDVTLRPGPDIPTTYSNVVLPEAAAYYGRHLDAAPDAFAAGILSRLQAGRTIPQADYVAAQRDRTVWRDRVDAALRSVDVLALPSLAIPAPAIGATEVQLRTGMEPLRPLMLRLTQLFNLTGHPAISIPCGSTSDGMPCGLQLVGRRHHTEALLAAAQACEAHITQSVRQERL